MKKIYVLLICLISINLCSEEKLLLKYDLEDFSVYYQNIPIQLGDDVMCVNSSLMDSDVILDSRTGYTMNRIGFGNDDIEILYFREDKNSLIHSIILNRDTVSTNRGISIGNTREDVKNVYMNLEGYNTDFINTKDYIYIQNVFSKSDNLIGDIEESYYGSASKSYVIVFMIDENDFVWKVVIQVVFE